MSTMKCLGLALGIALTVSSSAIAQQSDHTNNPAAQQAAPANPAASGAQQGSPTNNMATSGRARHRVATRTVAGRKIYALQLPSGCHLIKIGNNPARKICR
jgi:hypothetical protein